MLAVISVLLAGCVTPLPPTELDDPDALPERYGVVAVQVVSNARRLAPMLYRWSAIYAVNVDDTEQVYALRPSGTGLLRSQVFVGALPPGQYAVFNLHAYRQLGDSSYWLNAPLPRSLGTFIVDHQRVTSLGTVVFQPLGGEQEEAAGSPYLVTRYAEFEDLSLFVAEAYPDVYSSLDSSVLLGWEPDLLGDDREDINATIPKAAVALDHFWLDDQTIAMAATVGQFFMRDSESGEWSRIDTGYTNQIGALSTSNAGYLAAGERGLVLRADALEGPWSRVPGPGTQQAVYWIEQNASGEFFALTRASDQVHFYRVSEDFEQWREVRAFESTRGQPVSGAGQVHALNPGDGTIVLFGDEKRVVYNIDSGEMIFDSTPDFRSLERQPNGIYVGISGNFWLATATPRLSRNQGRDWETVTRIVDYERWKTESRSQPIVLDDGTQFAVSHRGYRNESTRRIEYEDEPRLRGIEEGSRSIDWRGPLDPDCTQLLPEISTEQAIFAMCNNGRLMRSDDLGASWTLDYWAGIAEDEEPGDGPDLF